MKATCRWLTEKRVALFVWLVDRFKLTAADAQAGVNDALRWACSNSHLPMAQWLADRFGLTAADARAVDNFALRSACCNGHLPVVRWLVDRFGITGDEVKHVLGAGWPDYMSRWRDLRFGDETETRARRGKAELTEAAARLLG